MTGFLHLGSDAVGLFYSPSRLDRLILEVVFLGEGTYLVFQYEHCYVFFFFVFFFRIYSYISKWKPAIRPEILEGKMVEKDSIK